MKTLCLSIFAATVALSATATAQPYNLTIAGYSPGGLVSTVGAGLDKALAAAYPGSTLTYQTSSGGLANAVMLDQKKVPLGFVQDIELNYALNGRSPIKQPLKDLRILFHPYSPASRFQATHVIVNKAWAEKHGIKTVADIAQKKPPMRIAFNRPGNLDGDMSLALMAAEGITPDTIKAWGGQVVRAASQEMTSLMLDRRLDGVSFGISIKHPRIQEMDNGLELVMLPHSETAIQKVTKEFGGKGCPIKASEYRFLAADTVSACVGMSVVVRSDMDPALAYNITKGIIENVEQYKAAHRLLKAAVTLESLTETGQAPFHPGAEKYFREKGLLK